MPVVRDDIRLVGEGKRRVMTSRDKESIDEAIEIGKVRARAKRQQSITPLSYITNNPSHARFPRTLPLIAACEGMDEGAGKGSRLGGGSYC